MTNAEFLEQVYRECKASGLTAVAQQLGISREQLVAELHDAGVAGDDGCPSQREIAERCRDVQRSWSDERRQSRWESAMHRAAG